MKLGGRILISLEGCESFFFLSYDRKEEKTGEGRGREM